MPMQNPSTKNWTLEEAPTAASAFGPRNRPTIASIELLPITDTAAAKKASFSVITKHSKTDAEPQDNVLAMPPAKPTYEAD